MQFYLVLVLAVVLVSVMFALQNAQAVPVAFLGWQFEGSLALLLLGTFALGVVAAILASVPSRLRSRSKIAAQNRAIKELEDNLVEYKKMATPVDSVN